MEMALIKIIIFTTLFLLPVNVFAQSKQPSTTPVIVTITEIQDFTDKIEALGTLRANETVDLTSSVTEIITKISFEDNQRVKKGDVLVEMDTAEELAELAEQNSFMAEAQRQVNRLSPLVKQGAASASILDENLRELEAAKARVSAIQSRINKRIIRAPFDGVLGLRNISIGALAQPGSMITTIDDDSVMKLDFSVPEVFLSTLKPNVIIKAETEAYPSKIFEGRIAFVDSRIDPVTRSIEARAIIDNTDKLLKPGLLMQVELQKNPRKALSVPEEALMANGPDNFVFVVKENEGNITAEKRKVEIGTRHFGKAEITNGLEENEKIVTHGILRIRTGTSLKITGTEKNGETLDQLLNSQSVTKKADK